VSGVKPRPDGDTIGVAMFGHGFMGDAHSRALRAIGATSAPAVLRPALVSLAGRDLRRVNVSRERYGWQEATTDWRAQVADERVGLFDNVGPNHLHVEPTLAAIEHGKHVVCEKPLAPTADQAYGLWSAAARAGVVHVCAFNYRYFPAIRLAKALVDDGTVGKPLHFRARFSVPRVQAGTTAGWRSSNPSAGGGVVGDLAAHHIDLARFLVGEIASVASRIDDPARPVEESVHALLAFGNGAVGTLEASQVVDMPTVESVIEVDGTDASLRFSVGRLNELEVIDGGGSHVVHATDPAHPFMRFWYPRGHPIGWGDSFLHELDGVLRAIAGVEPADPHLPTFSDGYRCAAICDAIKRAGTERCWVVVENSGLA
jgi:predicted dehydrogenase